MILMRLLPKMVQEKSHSIVRYVGLKEIEQEKNLKEHLINMVENVNIVDNQVN